MNEDDYFLENGELSQPKPKAMFPCVECDEEGYMWSAEDPTLYCKYHAEDAGLVPIDD